MNSEALQSYLATHLDLSTEEEAMIFDQVKQRKYLKNQYLVQQGDVCQYLSFVVSGCLKTFHSDEKGQEHILRFAIEDWWIADMDSFTFQTPSACNVQCLEETQVIQFSRPALDEIFSKVPKLEHMFRVIFQNAFIYSERRLLSSFTRSAKERYLEFQDKYPNIESRVPQYMVASYLGITKEFLSKIRSELRQDMP